MKVDEVYALAVVVGGRWVAKFSGEPVVTSQESMH